MKERFRRGLDPDQMLYDGFVNDADRALCQQILKQEPAALASQSWPFTDARLPELLFRYRARNFPDSLSDRRARPVARALPIAAARGRFQSGHVYTGVSRGACARRHHASNDRVRWMQLEQWVRDLSVEG